MANPELGIGAGDKPRISKSRLVFRVASTTLGVGGAVAAGIGMYDIYHNVRPQESELRRQVDIEYPKPSQDTLKISLDQIAQFRKDTNTALYDHDYDKYWQLVTSEEDAQKASQAVIKQDDINAQQLSMARHKKGLDFRSDKAFAVSFGGAYAAIFGAIGSIMSVIAPTRRTDNRRQLVSNTTQ